MKDDGNASVVAFWTGIHLIVNNALFSPHLLLPLLTGKKQKINPALFQKVEVFERHLIYFITCTHARRGQKAKNGQREITWDCFSLGLVWIRFDMAFLLDKIPLVFFLSSPYFHAFYSRSRPEKKGWENSLFDCRPSALTLVNNAMSSRFFLLLVMVFFEEKKHLSTVFGYITFKGEDNSDEIQEKNFYIFFFFLLVSPSSTTLLMDHCCC